MKGKWSSIRVTETVKKSLDEFKLYPEESYDKVLRRIIEFVTINKKDFLKWLGIPEETLKHYKKILKKIEK